MYLDHRVVRAVHDERIGWKRSVRAVYLPGSRAVRRQPVRPPCPQCGRGERLAS